MFTLTKKANGDHYDIIHAVVQGDTTVNTIIGEAQRDRTKPRFFNFTPTLEGRDMGLISATFDRMKSSPGGPGLLDELTGKLTPETKKEQPAPSLRKVDKKVKPQDVLKPIGEVQEQIAQEPAVAEVIGQYNDGLLSKDEASEKLAALGATVELIDRAA